MRFIARDRLKQVMSKFKEVKPIMVIGDLGVDKYTSGIVRRISPEAPVPVLEVNKEWLKLGLSANVSHNLETLSVANSLIGVIGHDRNGDVFLDLLRESQISPDGVIRIDKRSTTFKERIITNTQQICRVDYETIAHLEDEAESNLLKYINQTISQHSAVVIEDYGKGTLTSRVIAETIEVARKHKIPVMIDPSRTTNPCFYKNATLLKPNRQEAEMMVAALGFRTTSVPEMGRILQKELLISKVVITLGGEGMAIFENDCEQMPLIIPTVASEVFDVSGAGDTTISLIAASIAAGAKLEEASWIANCGAGIVVGKHGTATVTQDEILGYHKKLEEVFKQEKQ